MRQVVITGGPASGKTTALRFLGDNNPEVELVPEAATEVLLDGFPLPSEDNPWTQEWQNELQAEIAKKQIELESMAHERAKESGKKVIAQDRGLYDGAAYLSGGVEELESLTGLKREEILGRYHSVIYLGWLSSNDYETESNPMRFEDEARARELAKNVIDSWAIHPNLIEVTAQENRAQEVAALVLQATMLDH